MTMLPFVGIYFKRAHAWLHAKLKHHDHVEVKNDPVGEFPTQFAQRVNEMLDGEKYASCPGGVRQSVVTTTGDFGATLKRAVEDRFGK